MVARLIAWLLRLNLSDQNRQILTNATIDALKAVPLRATITVDDNRRIVVNGKPLDTDQATMLGSSAQAALDNFARKLIHEQIRFKAIDEGYLRSLDPTKDAVFYKAALWFAQEENDLLRALAGAQDSTL